MTPCVFGSPMRLFCIVLLGWRFVSRSNHSRHVQQHAAAHSNDGNTLPLNGIVIGKRPERSPEHETLQTELKHVFIYVVFQIITITPAKHPNSNILTNGSLLLDHCY